MANRKVIIRVDGNTNIGLGHIYRGIALAEMLKENFDILFITRKDSTTSPISEAGFQFKYLPEKVGLDNEPKWFKNNIEPNSIIICDGYEFKSEYQRQVKQQGFKLVYVDDLAEWRMYADIVINHAPGIKKEDYSAEPYTKFALGLDYALLRPVFLKAAKQKRKIDKIDTAFVCFGGSDIHNLVMKTVEAITAIAEIKRMNIIVGSAYKKYEELTGFAKKNAKAKVNIYKNLSQQKLVAVMQKSNFAIASASTVLIELLAVGLPVLAGYYAKNQMNIYNSLFEKRKIVGLGNLKKISHKEIKDSVIKNISENFKKINQSEKQSIDGNIQQRYIQMIKKI